MGCAIGTLRCRSDFVVLVGTPAMVSETGVAEGEKLPKGFKRWRLSVEAPEMDTNMNIATDEAAVLARIEGWAATEERVRVVLLTSSRSNPMSPLDVLSDYDIVLIVTDVDAYVTDDGWLQGFGTPLLVVRDAERVLEVAKQNCMVLYDDGTKIDYSIWPLALIDSVREGGRVPNEFDVGYRRVLDKDGLTLSWPRPTDRAHVIEKPTDDEFQTLIQEFWWVATYVAKNLWRDELVSVKVLLDHEMKYLLLRKLLEWRIAIDHEGPVKSGFFGRGLRRHLDTETWTEFTETYVGSNRHDNWEALFATMDLFRRVATYVGHTLGYAYPHAMDATVSAYVRQIWRMQGSART